MNKENKMSLSLFLLFFISMGIITIFTNSFAIGVLIISFIYGIILSILIIIKNRSEKFKNWLSKS